MEILLMNFLFVLQKRKTKQRKKKGKKKEEKWNFHSQVIFLTQACNCSVSYSSIKKFRNSCLVEPSFVQYASYGVFLNFYAYSGGAFPCKWILFRFWVS